MRNIIFSVLALVFPMSVAAQHGTCGTNVEWDISNDTIYVYGEGQMNDFTSETAANTVRPSWEPYKTEIRHVVVAGNVTKIGDFAFCGYDVESVEIGEGTLKIGNRTFYKCASLEKLVLPNSLEVIGDNFQSYTENGMSFADCISLNELTLPEHLKSIGINGFLRCKISKVYWNAENAVVNGSPYSPNDNPVFNGCPIKEVCFGKKVLSVPSRAFFNIGALSEVSTCGTIEYVGADAFTGTSWLGNAIEKETVLYIDHAAYTYTADTQLTTPIKLVIKEGTTSITANALYDNKRLVQVTLPLSLKSIGENAFKGCSSLGEIVYNSRKIEDLVGSPFSSSVYSFEFGDEVEYLPSYLLCGCSGIKKLTLPNSLKGIGANVFNECSGLTELAIPDNVECIGRLSIYNLANLEKLTIGESLKTIDYYYLFGQCPKLSTVYWNAISLDRKSYDPYHDTDRCHAPVENLVFGDKVEYVPGNMFYNSSILKNVTLGSSVKVIGEAAFRACSSLKAIYLPESLETIESYAFYGAGLESVFIPQNVTSVGAWGLGMRSLTSVISVPASAPKCTSSFIDCPKEMVLYVPDVKYNNGWEQYGSQMQPMLAQSENVYYYTGDTPQMQLTCNIPDYELVSLAEGVLDGSVGEHQVKLSASFKGERDFTADVTLRYTILKGMQSISWSQTFDDIYKGDKIELTASATSGLDVSYYPYSQNIEIVKENGKTFLICKEEGLAELGVMQYGNDNWEAAETVIKDFYIQNDNTGIDNSCANGISVYGNDGHEIVVEGITMPSVIKVFSANGRLMTISRSARNMTIPIGTPGLYFVSVGSQVFKVIVR